MDLVSLKRKYRKIFCTRVAGYEIYWRPLSLREHDIYSKIIELDLSPLSKIQDQIFREVVLSVDIIDQMNNLPPGIVFSISNTVLTISGNLLRTTADLDRINDDLETLRTVVNSNPYEKIMIDICRAFPAYTPEKLEELDYYELLRLLIMSEQVLQETVYKLELAKKEDSLIDHIFRHKKEAELADSSAPSTGIPDAPDLRRMMLDPNGNPNLSQKQARQLEMIDRIKSKR